MVEHARSFTPAPEKQLIKIDPATTTFLELVAKSPKNPEKWGEKQWKRIRQVYNDWRNRHRKEKPNVDEFEKATSKDILVCSGIPLLDPKEPLGFRLAARGLEKLRLFALKMHGDNIVSKK